MGGGQVSDFPISPISPGKLLSIFVCAAFFLKSARWRTAPTIAPHGPCVRNSASPQFGLFTFPICSFFGVPSILLSKIKENEKPKIRNWKRESGHEKPETRNRCVERRKVLEAFWAGDRSPKCTALRKKFVQDQRKRETENPKPETRL